MGCKGKPDITHALGIDSDIDRVFEIGSNNRSCGYSHLFHGYRMTGDRRCAGASVADAYYGGVALFFDLSPEPGIIFKITPDFIYIFPVGFRIFFGEQLV